MMIAIVLFSQGASRLARAQLWSSVLEDARAIDWGEAGAGTLPARSQVCATMNSTASASDINAAIASCGSDEVVLLTAGTYTIGAPGIVFDGKSDVTLRGEGANLTFLNFIGANDCGGPSAGVCVQAQVPLDPGQPQNTATWTAGFLKGATSISLSNVTGLQVGSLLALGQSWDPLTSDNQQVYQCHGFECTVSGGNDIGGPGMEQNQIVSVTSVSAGPCPCTVGISPGLYMPNWQAARNPKAMWNDVAPIRGVGIESMSLDFSGTSAQSGVQFFYATQSWLKNVRSIRPANHHVKAIVAAHITVRDSYFFDGQNHASESYGFNAFMASANLVENNIFQYITAPLMNESSTGSVYGYNYSINDYYGDGTWAQASMYNHGPNGNFILFESNDGYGLTLDNYHGTSHFVTAFRNRLYGFEGINQNQTVPVYIYSYNRFTNIIGNVLGTYGYHTTYQNIRGVDAENFSSCNVAIYAVGWGGNCDNGDGSPASDDRAGETLLRWGNYDTVSSATAFNPANIPSTDTFFPNFVPASQDLPGSFYLPGKPAWFGTQDWPAIGPDVVGGTEMNVGGHNDRIPARRCFEDVMGGTFGDSVPRSFDSAFCYIFGPPDTLAPGTPTGLIVL